MTSKITLVTPPDYFENKNFSILFVGMSDKTQTEVSQWLKDHPIYPDCNLYVYQGDDNIPWLLYAKHRCSATLIDYDVSDANIVYMGSYLVGYSNVFYTTTNTAISDLLSHISNNFVPSTITFLERVFDVKN